MVAGSDHGSVRNLRFKVGVSVLKKVQPETVFVLLYINRHHADGAVARMVVGVHQVLDNIYPAHGAGVRQICSYPHLDGSIESLYHGRFLFALTGKSVAYRGVSSESGSSS